MNDLLYKLLPAILSIAVGQVLYLKMDQRYDLTNKVSTKIPVSKSWKPSFCIISIFLTLFIIGLIGIYLISIPSLLYIILNGLIIGIGISIANKLSSQK